MSARASTAGDEETGASSVSRHLAVWRQVLVQAVGREAQFRAQANATVLVGVLQLGLTLVPVLVLFGYVEEVNGWSGGAVVAVVGCYEIAASLLAAFVAPNLGRMTAYIAHGDLDLVLIRPVSSQAYILARWVEPAELVNVVPGAAVLVAGLVRGGVHPNSVQVLAGLGWFGLGLVAITCVWANLAYLAFWFSASDPIGELMNDLLAVGRFPVAFFPRAVRVLMLIAVPVGLVTSVPIGALAGSTSPGWLAAAAGGVAAAVVLTRVHWQRALRRYASASS